MGQPGSSLTTARHLRFAAALESLMLLQELAFVVDPAKRLLASRRAAAARPLIVVPSVSVVIAGHRSPPVCGGSGCRSDSCIRSDRSPRSERNGPAYDLRVPAGFQGGSGETRPSVQGR